MLVRGPSQTYAQLLAEVRELLRTAPSVDAIKDSDSIPWIGRAAAVIEEWSLPKTILFARAVDNVHSMYRSQDGWREILMMLHQAQHDLTMKVAGPSSVSIADGSTFEYFDAIRELVETANEDVLFVDPYLDAEFVSRYLPYVKANVTVRLLTRHKVSQLLPSVVAFCSQHGTKIEVRSSDTLHDRYIFVDRSRCHQSGASFKDGAKKAQTTIAEIVDAFPAMLIAYDGYWNAAKLEG